VPAENRAEAVLHVSEPLPANATGEVFGDAQQQ
jgi:hypothetical protein